MNDIPAIATHGDRTSGFTPRQTWVLSYLIFFVCCIIQLLLVVVIEIFDLYGIEWLTSTFWVATFFTFISMNATILLYVPRPVTA